MAPRAIAHFAQPKGRHCMKHPLITADIFLFNIPKCVDTFTEINYEMLEGIKDGELFPQSMTVKE